MYKKGMVFLANKATIVDIDKNDVDKKYLLEVRSALPVAGSIEFWVSEKELNALPQLTK